MSHSSSVTNPAIGTSIGVTSSIHEGAKPNSDPLIAENSRDSSTSNPQTTRTEEKTLPMQACFFCKSRHLKCDGANPCVQCSLRKQECVYNTPPRKRGRKVRGGENTPSKRTKTSESDRSSPTESSESLYTLASRGTQELDAKKTSLLSPQQISTLRLIERGDVSSLRIEDVVDLVITQHQKLNTWKAKQKLIQTDGLTDLDDFSQDLELDPLLGADIPLSENYPDDLSFVQALIQSFSTRNGMFYPNGTIPIDVALASSYLKRFNSAKEFRQLLKGTLSELTDAYCYGIVLSVSCSILMRWNLGSEYAARSDMIIRNLLRSQVSQNPLFVAKLLSCIGYQIHFHLGRGDFAEARSHILEQYNFYNGCRGTTPLAIAHTLYGGMAAMTGSVEDRLHWIKCAESLPQAAASPLNEAIRIVATAGQIYAKDEPLLDWRNLFQKCSKEEAQVRQKLYDAIESIVPKVESFPMYVFTNQPAVFGALYHIFNGTKALLAFQLGKTDEALAFSFSTIQAMRHVDPTILSMYQLFSNAYAIQVAAALLQKDLYKAGLEFLRPQTTAFPIGAKIYERLVQQTSIADLEFSRYPMQYAANQPLPPTHSNQQLSGILDQASNYSVAPDTLPGLSLLSSDVAFRGGRNDLPNFGPTSLGFPPHPEGWAASMGHIRVPARPTIDTSRTLLSSVAPQTHPSSSSSFQL